MEGNSVWEWAVAEFGSADLGHHGRTRRVVPMAAAFAHKGTSLVTEAIVDNAEREGAYRLLESDRLYALELLSSTCRATVERCADLPYVFVATDGSSLNMADPLGIRETGPIGDKKHGARGFLLLSALAVSPHGVPLGLLAQCWWRRAAAPVTRQASKRKVADKETQHWLAAQTMARDHLAGTSCRPWFQDKALKSGGCNIEDTQLHGERGMRMLTVLLSAVATRLLRLTYLARKEPKLPASQVFSPVEIRAILRRKRRRAPHARLTIAIVTTWVAELGGYTGKQSGGPPGFLTLGRGLRRIRDATALLQPVEEIDEPE